MTGLPDSGRRAWLQGLVAAGASAALGRASAAEPVTDPARGPQLVIRGVHLLSMDPVLGEQRDCDVLVQGARIMAVGAGLVARGARQIDGRGSIAIPGLVDAHWHMWSALARSAGPAQDGRGFRQVLRDLGARCTPETAQLALRLATAQARRAGITTINNWAHNLRDPEFADAEYGAMVASGLRGRFWYGYAQDIAADAVMDLAAIERWQRSVSQQRASRVDLGMAVRGPERTEEPVWREEFAFAGDRGLPLSVHVAATPDAQHKRAIRTLHAAQMLRHGMQLVHATHAGQEDIDRIAAAGASVCLTPVTELRAGYGLAPVQALLRARVPVSLGIGTTLLAGRADPYAVMRAALHVAAAAAGSEHALRAETVLYWATQGGANAMGWGARIGSITPGKHADLVLIDALHPDMAPVDYAAASVAQSATPAAVTHVIANGVVHEAAAMQAELRELAALAEEAWRGLWR